MFDKVFSWNLTVKKIIPYACHFSQSVVGVGNFYLPVLSFVVVVFSLVVVLCPIHLSCPWEFYFLFVARGLLA